MKRRLLVSCLAIGLFSGFISTPSASAQQSINFFVGGFFPRSLEARDSTDVLFQNYFEGAPPPKLLEFDINDFRGVTAGAEYLVGLGNFFDAGLGIGFYSQTSPSIYLDFTHPNGAEIEQDLKLRVVPVTATFRFLPLGHSGGIVPYVGGGVAIYRWRYAETGEFIDDAGDIFSDFDTFEASGTTVGPVVLAGARIPVGGGGSGFGGEARWQRGKADLPADRFFGTTLDLGGFNVLFTINVGF